MERSSLRGCRPTGWRLSIALAMGLGLGAAAADDESTPRKSVGSGRGNAPHHARLREGMKEMRPTKPPACPRRARENVATVPAPRSMGDLFVRMGERFSTNPARAWEGMLSDLSSMEGPALEGVVVDREEERRAGKEARLRYLADARRAGHAEVDDPSRVAYLQALVDRLARRMEHRARYPRVEVSLIDAPIPDGQCFPGGSIIVTTALLREPDEATVAGVLAHELAHLDLGHMYEFTRRSKLMRRPFPSEPADFASFDAMFTRQAALLGMMMRPFRPEQESEADCAAATWLFLEGYDPRALVGFFERLHARRNDAPDAGIPFLAFARTHPYSLDRRDHVLARTRQLLRWRPNARLGLFPEALANLKPRDAEPGAVPKGQ